jgi:acetoacetate decarboxylase
MGFPKKLGKTYKTDYNPMHPKMDTPHAGSKLKGYVVAHGERLMEGMVTLEDQIEASDLPAPMGLPVFNIRHFPNIKRGAPPSVLELVRLDVEDVDYGDVWRGDATIELFPSEVEEHTRLAPNGVVGGYLFSGRTTVTGGRVLHSWV